MILTAGESLIDMLPRDTVDGGTAFQPHAGGSVFNTAIALGRLGIRTGFFSGISTDLFGQLLFDTLTEAHVDASFSARSDRPTTLAFVTLTDGEASYAFYDEATASRMLSEDDLPQVDDDVAAMFFGGISLVVEPCCATFEALMVRESVTRPTMLDPNIRPGFIRDEASFRERILRMIELADIVKVSDEDLSWVMGQGSQSDLAAEMRALGPAIVLVTEGVDGATAYHEGGIVGVPATEVEVVDTVGAGDTFNAGILASFHEQGVLTKRALREVSGNEIKAAMRLGSQAAAVTVSRAGADSPWRNELSL